VLLARLPAPLKPAAMLLQQSHMGMSPNNALQPTPARFALRLPRSVAHSARLSAGVRRLLPAHDCVFLTHQNELHCHAA
jgi:hypothetical protein